jgi:hypothetical protein
MTVSPDKADTTTREGPPPESPEPVSREEEERRKKRKDEADAVAALLKEAFGTASVEAAPARESPPEPAPPVQPPAPQPIQRASLMENARTALSLALQKATTALHDFGIPPAMLLVYGAVTFLLVIFGVSLPAVLGSLGLMALLTALKLKPSDVLGIMSLLLLAMEAADIWRQWGRISSIFGL